MFFTAGQTSETITITITDDNISELDETIILSLSNYVYLKTGDITSQTITINDNDAPPTVSFDTVSSSASESSNASIAISLSNPSSQTVTVDYNLGAGTATGSGTDYTLSSGTFTFSPGETSKTLDFSINDDSIDEDNETVIITISNPTNSSLGSNTTHTYTINDNDPTPRVQFDNLTSEAYESVTSVNIPVSLSSGSSKTISVDYTVTGGTAVGSGADCDIEVYKSV